MTVRKHSNNFVTTLDGAITDSATTITLTATAGLPTLGAGEVCRLNISDGSNVEIVEVTNISGSDIDIIRGQENTTPTAFADLDDVELTATANSLDRKLDKDSTEDFTTSENISLTDGYVALTEISLPSNPAANIGLLYTRDDGGTTTPYFLDSSGTETNLIAPSGDSWSDLVDSDIVPDTDSTYDLGTTGVRFAETYTDALDVTNNITVGGTVDGRDIATDGSKLDGVEALADVTDEANVVSSLDGATLTDVTVASTDKVVVQDVSDSDNVKTVTAQSIADLGGGGGDMILADAQTNTGIKSFNSGTVVYKGSVSGTTTLNASGIAGTTTITMPAESGAMVLEASTNTLTNKSFDANGTGNSLTNVDVADLANGTDGELITWDAAGAPATVSVGTATHVLTSNGPGTAPTFQAGGGGGDPDQNLWETMSSDSGSSAASTTTDTFTLTGGIGIETSITGDACTFNMDINGLTAGSGLQFFATDSVAYFDGSVGAERKLSPDVFMYELISQSADITTALDIAADYIPLADASVFQPKKVLPDNLVETVINNVTDTAVAAGDRFTFTDTSDSDNIKSDTIQGILDLAGTAPIAATQADQETGTSTTTFVSPGRQQYHESAAKCWINFNGTGTVSIDGSYNITSLVDNGTGLYSINIATDFSNTNYALAGMCGDDGTANQNIFTFLDGVKNVGDFDIQTRISGGAAFDVEDCSVILFGDQ